MRIQEIIEAFDTVDTGTVLTQTPTGYAKALDLSNNRQIVFIAEKQGDRWTIGFQEQNPQEQPAGKSKIAGVSATGRQDVTGKGDAQRIMSFVKNSMDQFINDYKPERMVFRADRADGARADVYQKMVQRYLPNNYSADAVERSISGKNYREFEIVRKDIVAKDRTAQWRKVARAGDDQNVYPTGGMPGSRTTAFQDQQYIKDLERKAAEHPDDANISAELAKMKRLASLTQR